MRFQLTLNMPSRSGNPIHQIIADVNVPTIKKFVEMLNEDQFVMVMEIYRDGDSGSYYEVGELAINSNIVGKVKVFNS